MRDYFRHLVAADYLGKPIVLSYVCILKNGNLRGILCILYTAAVSLVGHKIT